MTIEKFELRKEILEMMFYDLFFDTKDIASSFDLTMKQAYAHMKFLENKELVCGEAYNKTGINQDRGTNRVYSIRWEPYYCSERDGDDYWSEVVGMLKKAMRM